MHRRSLITAIAVIAALFVVADGNLPARNRPEPAGIVLLGAALPRRTATETARATALEGRCEGVRHEQGFTLIELSIVLVIIGLIIGGVLVGQDMIKAAQTRAQIAQIERYNSGANSFKAKYNGIPGDLNLADANNFGFYTSGCLGDGSFPQGGRNGNGLIEGAGLADSSAGIMGENMLFWTDLSQAGFIDGNFPGNGYASAGCLGASPNLNLTLGNQYIGDYLPAGKIGYGTFLHVYSTSGANYFLLTQLTSFATASSNVVGTPSIPVSQAYNIDKKIDDGLPTSGNVQTTNIVNNALAQSPNANPDTAGTCYNSSTLTYSTNISNGSGPNCALSFKMQGVAR